MLRFLRNNIQNKKQNHIKNAFTLAEVLITLVIIGIVAALAIPSVIVNYKKHQTEVKLKKIYGTLGKAFNLAQMEYGSAKSWDWGHEYYAETASESLNFANKYIFPHLNGEKNFSTIQEDTKTKKTYGFMTSDGVGIDVRLGGDKWSHQIDNNSWCEVVFDINGGQKPNAYGKDIFTVYLYSHKGLASALNYSWHISTASGEKSYGREWVVGRCSSMPSYGSVCFDLIKDNNWKMPDDYPW